MVFTMKYPTNYGDLTWSSTLKNTIAPARPQIPSRPLWKEKCKKIQKPILLRSLGQNRIFHLILKVVDNHHPTVWQCTSPSLWKICDFSIVQVNCQSPCPSQSLLPVHNHPVHLHGMLIPLSLRWVMHWLYATLLNPMVPWLTAYIPGFYSCHCLAHCPW